MKISYFSLLLLLLVFFPAGLFSMVALIPGSGQAYPGYNFMLSLHVLGYIVALACFLLSIIEIVKRRSYKEAVKIISVPFIYGIIALCIVFTTFLFIG